MWYPIYFYDHNRSGVADQRRWTASLRRRIPTLKANDVEIPMFRLTIRSSLTSTNVSVSFDMKLDRQDQHLIDTDKLNGVTDYKWIILYFISLNFYCLLKNKFDWIWEYSKTKIGHNFLPGLVRRNLNADLNVSVLRKKISKFYEHMMLS